MKIWICDDNSLNNMPLLQDSDLIGVKQSVTFDVKTETLDAEGYHVVITKLVPGKLLVEVQLDSNREFCLTSPLYADTVYDSVEDFCKFTLSSVIEIAFNRLNKFFPQKANF